MFKSLTARVAVFLVCATVATVGLIAGIEYTIHTDRIQEQSVERYRLIARQTLTVMVLAMKQEAPRSIGEILEAMGREKGVEWIHVLGTDGTIHHSTRPEMIGQKVRPFNTAWVNKHEVHFIPGQHSSDTLVTIMEPIYNEPRCQSCHNEGSINGVMQMRLDTSPAVAGYRAERTALILGVGLVQILLFALLWLLFRGFLIKPVRNLLGSMRKVAAGDLKERVLIESPREFAELGVQFNAMVQKLQKAKIQTERQYEESMARADRLATVGEMATAMSHEIQNPLAGLSGALQILRKDPEMEKRREVFDEMLSAVDRLGKTVGDLLSYGRPPKPQLAPCDINQSVRGVLFFIRQQQTPQTRVQIVEELAPDLPVAWADAQQLQQVLLNICLNAMQAMPDGGTLSAKTSVNGNGKSRNLHITISDTGVGIANDDLENVFKPFFTTRHRGTGLGLAISKRIVEESGGTIRLKSQTGKGTTVEIEIPPENANYSQGESKAEQP